MTSDKRSPLPYGSEVQLNNTRYVIHKILGCGGSCLAYLAYRQPTNYEQSLGLTQMETVIKEFYPFEQAEEIERIGLSLNSSNKTLFAQQKNRFESGVATQIAYYSHDSNHSLPPAELAEEYGTAYSVISLTNGNVISKSLEERTLKETADIITSLCNAVTKIHNTGKLYLDIKPDNIFLYNAENNETRRIALFDFDTAIATDKISTAVIPFSPGWSAPEQVSGWREKISFATDIYSVGAFVYWLYSGEIVSSAVLNEIARKRDSFLDSIPLLKNGTFLRKQVAQILSVTLRRESCERAQRIEELPL